MSKSMFVKYVVKEDQIYLNRVDQCLLESVNLIKLF